MHKRVKRKKRRRYTCLFLVTLFVIGLILFFQKDSHKFLRTTNIEQVKIIDDGRISFLYDVEASDVQGVLNEYDGGVSKNDKIFPSRDAKVFAGDRIFINREKKLIVKVDGEKKEFKTFGDKIKTVLMRNNIELDENDIIVPHGDIVISDNIEVEITRVEFKEEVTTKKIAFETVLKKDDDINFLKKYTDQEGRN